MLMAKHSKKEGNKVEQVMPEIKKANLKPVAAKKQPAINRQLLWFI